VETLANSNIEIEEIQEFRDSGILELWKKFAIIPQLLRFLNSSIP
jgi:hypothetical protein